LLGLGLSVFLLASIDLSLGLLVGVSLAMPLALLQYVNSIKQHLKEQAELKERRDAITALRWYKWTPKEEKRIERFTHAPKKWWRRGITLLLFSSVPFLAEIATEAFNLPVPNITFYSLSLPPFFTSGFVLVMFGIAYVIRFSLFMVR